MEKNNYLKGLKDTRPWGSWEVIDSGNNFCVKHIIIAPGGVLSLQLHHCRSEHWVIVKGTASITLENAEFTKSAGESVYVPLMARHRIRNTTNETVELIEVQYGDNLDEEDIVRLDDVYGRVK